MIKKHVVIKKSDIYENSFICAVACSNNERGGIKGKLLDHSTSFVVKDDKVEKIPDQ